MRSMRLNGGVAAQVDAGCQVDRSARREAQGRGRLKLRQYGRGHGEVAAGSWRSAEQHAIATQGHGSATDVERAEQRSTTGSHPASVRRACQAGAGAQCDVTTTARLKPAARPGCSCARSETATKAAPAAPAPVRPIEATSVGAAKLPAAMRAGGHRCIAFEGDIVTRDQHHFVGTEHDAITDLHRIGGYFHGIAAAGGLPPITSRPAFQLSSTSACTCTVVPPVAAWRTISSASAERSMRAARPPGAALARTVPVACSAEPTSSEKMPASAGSTARGRSARCASAGKNFEASDSGVLAEALSVAARPHGIAREQRISRNIAHAEGAARSHYGRAVRQRTQCSRPAIQWYRVGRLPGKHRAAMHSAPAAADRPPPQDHWWLRSAPGCHPVAGPNHRTRADRTERTVPATKARWHTGRV